MFLYNYMDLEIAHKIDKKPVMQPDYTKHYHDFYEIYFFVRGNVLYTVEEEKKFLKSVIWCLYSQVSIILLLFWIIHQFMKDM